MQKLVSAVCTEAIGRLENVMPSSSIIGSLDSKGGSSLRSIGAEQHSLTIVLAGRGNSQASTMVRQTSERYCSLCTGLNRRSEDSIYQSYSKNKELVLLGHLWWSRPLAFKV